MVDNVKSKYIVKGIFENIKKKENWILLNIIKE